MKLKLNLIFLFVLLTFTDKAFSLSDYQIKIFCKKERLYLTCIKKLQEKKSNLEKGNVIEIPVIPYNKR
jgi:hypothetical protein